MKITFELIMAIAFTFGLTLAYFEIMQPHEKEYVSNCCEYPYRHINAVNKYNKPESKFYCLNCKKWCDIKERYKGETNVK